MQKGKINPGTVILYPFSLLYLLGVGIRNLLFNWEVLPSASYKLPVISVGNITIGGTGKTPHVEYLVELLKDDFKLACLSRGYKRKTRRFMLADEQSATAMIGDEPRQYKQKYPELTVAVDRRRVNGINELLKLSPPVEVVLLDDAFQHRYVTPGKSILLTNFNRLITDDWPLPSGRLREPVKAKKRADIILVTKCPGRLKPLEMRDIVNRIGLELHQHLFFTTIKYDPIRPVFRDVDRKEEHYFKNKGVPLLLLTGIADPRPIRSFARSISTRLHEMKFPDHHTYTEKDLEKIKEKLESLDHPDVLILTTEKDAVKLQEMNVPEPIKKQLYYVPIRVSFMDDKQEKEFNQIILNYVRSNQRNSILHKGPDHPSA
jgi:tetraacyldisaccharide 4'-kinase